MANCKITKSFFKELARMTARCSHDCEDCALGTKSEFYNENSCMEYMMNNADDAIEMVQLWSDNNPAKTRMDDFFEKHPNADANSLGSPVACCKSLGYIDVCPVVNTSTKSCLDCWTTPLEE